MIVESIKRLRRMYILSRVENKTIPFVLREGKALIIAPHPDDEIFACGGLIAKKKQLGEVVRVLFLSRGEGSHRSCCATNEQTIGEVRQQLAADACSLLGLRYGDLLWCDFPDGAIPGKADPIFAEAASRLSKIFNACTPTEIYAPHPHDCWPDHRRAVELVLAAVSLAKYSPALYFYPVWMWQNLRLCGLGQLKGWQTLRLDIRTVREKKHSAIKQYLAATNPACGIPYCGNLPSGFLDPFHKDYEIFFQQSKVGRP